MAIQFKMPDRAVTPETAQGFGVVIGERDGDFIFIKQPGDEQPLKVRLYHARDGRWFVQGIRTTSLGLSPAQYRDIYVETLTEFYERRAQR